MYTLERPVFKLLLFEIEDQTPLMNTTCSTLKSLQLQPGHCQAMHVYAVASRQRWRSSRVPW